jgi:uncharacterized protein YeaO (DUF488 family)
MIYTSYFAFIPKLPPDVLKMSVALITPEWAKVDGCLPYLNPTEKLLREAKSGKIPSDEYTKKYRDEILAKLSPIKVYNELLKILEDSGKKDLALLCYEKPGDVCHRRFIAEWFEDAVLISVPEYTVEDRHLSLV